MKKGRSRKHRYTFPFPQKWEIREQQLLYSEESFLPENLPRLQELHPVHNLSAIFDECHNYVYANEGLLKEKIFHEIVKLPVGKLEISESLEQLRWLENNKDILVDITDFESIGIDTPEDLKKLINNI